MFCLFCFYLHVYRILQIWMRTVKNCFYPRESCLLIDLFITELCFILFFISCHISIIIIPPTQQSCKGIYLDQHVCLTITYCLSVMLYQPCCCYVTEGYTWISMSVWPPRVAKIPLSKYCLSVLVVHVSTSIFICYLTVGVS